MIPTPSPARSAEAGADEGDRRSRRGRDDAEGEARATKPKLPLTRAKNQPSGFAPAAFLRLLRSSHRAPLVASVAVAGGTAGGASRLCNHERGAVEEEMSHGKSRQPELRTSSRLSKPAEPQQGPEAAKPAAAPKPASSVRPKPASRSKAQSGQGQTVRAVRPGRRQSGSFAVAAAGQPARPTMAAQRQSDSTTSAAQRHRGGSAGAATSKAAPAVVRRLGSLGATPAAELIEDEAATSPRRPGRVRIIALDLDQRAALPSGGAALFHAVRARKPSRARPSGEARPRKDRRDIARHGDSRRRRSSTPQCARLANGLATARSASVSASPTRKPLSGICAFEIVEQRRQRLALGLVGGGQIAVAAKEARRDDAVEEDLRRRTRTGSCRRIRRTRSSARAPWARPGSAPDRDISPRDNGRSPSCRRA